jgi:hypothetical protein
MTRIPYVLCMSLVALAATAQDLTVGNETETEPADDKPAVTAKASEAAPGDEEFKPPPGFKTKKRGEIVLYCMRDSTVGTRFKTEKCYDEAQMRDYLIAQQENKRDIERVRNTCSTGAGEYCRRQ